MLEEINFPKLKVAYVRLGHNGTTFKMKKLTTLVIDWANSPFDYISPSLAIKIAAPLDTAWIDAMFSALPVVTGGQTCDVRYCDGYAGCDPTIATAKGWIVL